MATQAQLKATEAYRKKSVKTFSLKFFPADHDLYEHLQNQPKKAEYLRELIRKDMDK
ncbi:hypothetical protein [Atopobium fossor]|uniref:hypothetical protein n=1 Tax=Atopobium fossor TaxID=39487 RepID=UPI00040E4C59|nr:hypothetical protein [Atopobium fossor]